MKIAVCASMSFADRVLALKEKLQALGHEVVVPKEIHKHLDPNNPVDNKAEKMELDVIRVYFDLIKNSDSVLVANYDKNSIAGYIGGNSFLEMAFAYVLHKKIYVLNELPTMSYSDEIEAMHPIVLQGNLTHLA